MVSSENPNVVPPMDAINITIGIISFSRPFKRLITYIRPASSDLLFPIIPKHPLNTNTNKIISIAPRNPCIGADKTSQIPCGFEFTCV